MPRIQHTFILVVLLLVLFPIFSFAAPPDAGILLNQQRQPVTPLPERLPRPEGEEGRRPPLAETGAKVLVKAFRFSGLDGLVTEAELQDLLANSVGKELSLVELQELTARVTKYLREKKGYLLAKAYLPRQDVTEGIIEIAILAGRIDGVEIDVKPPSRISRILLQGFADKAIPRDSPARMEHIEQAVLTIKDLPGIDAHASLGPGTAPGTVSMKINTIEGDLISGSIIGDNFGDRYTGEWRGTGKLAANDPFGLGDLLQVSVTGAENLSQSQISYALPLAASGSKVTLLYNWLSYELGKELSVLDAEGYAYTLGFNLNYVLKRTRTSSLWSGMGFETQKMIDEANGQTLSDRKIRSANLTFSGSFYDNFGGGGLTAANFTIYGGDFIINDYGGAKAIDDAGPQASGNFLRTTYLLSRLQRITRNLSFLANIRGQFSADNLDSSQKFILGGPTGVRAYPASEGSGDEGHLLTTEARYDFDFLPAGFATQLVGFLDVGWLELHHVSWDGSITNATGSNDYLLSGAGIGLNISKGNLYTIRATYAHTIDNNDGRDINGKDTDNRSDDNRFWLQALVWF